MFEIDLMIIRKMTDELHKCERQLRAQSDTLENTMRLLDRLETDGMERVRRNLTRQSENLRQEVQNVRSLCQALDKICRCYEQSETRAENLFEEQSSPGTVWQAVRLIDIRNILA